MILDVTVDVTAKEKRRKIKKTDHEGRRRLRPGIRPWRRYPHSAPDKRACRSSSGVCEPDSVAPRCTEPSSNPKPTHPKERKKESTRDSFFLWRCRPDLNRRITVLQTGALPLGYCTKFSIAYVLYQSFLPLSRGKRLFYTKRFSLFFVTCFLSIICEKNAGVNATSLYFLIIISIT